MPHFPKPFFKQARGCWYVEVDRRQINLGPDRTAAFARYHELMRTPRLRSVQSETFAALADAFLEWLAAQRSPETFEWYRYRLQRFCELHPHLRASELKPYHVQKWIDGYPHLSRTSRRNHVRAVKRCMKWAIQQGYLDQNPIHYLEVPGAERRETTVTAAEYSQLLACIRDEALRDLVVTTWETGCRPQESLRVEKRHVDVAHHRWVFPPSESKGKRQPRIVYLTDQAWDFTQRRMLRFPTGPLFRNSADQPWTTDAVNCAFDRIRVRLYQQTLQETDAKALSDEIQRLLPTLKRTRRTRGVDVSKSPTDLKVEARRKALSRRAHQLVPRYSLHALRHAWATRALQSGLDGLTVAILMGHSDPSTLARVYQHLAHHPDHLLVQARRAAGQ
ncbi:MAG: tyrosine-type recombinase/integrase [Planctomycetaceae bacterium]